MTVSALSVASLKPPSLVTGPKLLLMRGANE